MKNTITKYGDALDIMTKDKYLAFRTNIVNPFIKIITELKI